MKAWWRNWRRQAARAEICEATQLKEEEKEKQTVLESEAGGKYLRQLKKRKYELGGGSCILQSIMRRESRNEGEGGKESYNWRAKKLLYEGGVYAPAWNDIWNIWWYTAARWKAKTAESAGETWRKAQKSPFSLRPENASIEALKRRIPAILNIWPM